ncbi:MAG: hypothetical protein ACOCTH_02820 [Halodesulfurarchaeum sp.]
MRAAQAAIEVVREECGDMGMDVVEIDDGMFMEVPEEAARIARETGDSPVPLNQFERRVEEDEFLRNWLAGMADRSGVGSDDYDLYRHVVHSWADSFFDNGLDFRPSDIPEATVDRIARS